MTIMFKMTVRCKPLWLLIEILRENSSIVILFIYFIIQNNYSVLIYLNYNYFLRFKAESASLLWSVT